MRRAKKEQDKVVSNFGINPKNPDELVSIVKEQQEELDKIQGASKRGMPSTQMAPPSLSTHSHPSTQRDVNKPSFRPKKG